MEERFGSVLVLGGLLLALLAVFVARARAGAAQRRPWKPRLQDDAALRRVLERLARKHRQPAMAAALVWGGDIVARAVVGTAVDGGERPLAPDCRFHIGSTTKGLTALLVAILVKEKRLRYDTTLGEALSGLPLRDEYRRVTVRDLLLHRSGVMALQDTRQEDPEVVRRLWTELPARERDSRRQRLEMARMVLARPPLFAAGTRHVYSNVGYALLGAVAETAAGESFESLLEKRVLRALGMHTARSGGWPASPAEPDQPRGHYVDRGHLRPQALGDEYVFPDWMNPAGGVHCSIEDFARYARETLLGLRGQGTLLDQAGYREMHSVHAEVRLGEMYGPMLAATQGAVGSRSGRATIRLGLGWGLLPARDGLLSAGDGSGGTFYARIAVHPTIDAAFVAATSSGGGAPAIGKAIREATGFGW
jgi:CubicO group peptidase (beta-lactamase class C family)